MTLFRSSDRPLVKNFPNLPAFSSLKPSEKMEDCLIRANTVSSLLEVAREKTQKCCHFLLLSRIYLIFMRNHDFHETSQSFFLILEKPSKNQQNWRNQEIPNYEKVISDSALPLLNVISKTFYVERFCCSKTGRSKIFCTGKWCCACKTFRHKEWIRFQAKIVYKVRKTGELFLGSWVFKLLWLQTLH